MNKNHTRIGILLAAFLFSGKPCPAQDPPKLTLKQAVALAQANSHELALARVRYTIAQNRTQVYRAEFEPNFYTSSGAVYSKGFPQIPGGQPPAIFELSYSQTVFDGPLRGQLQAARERAKNQKIELDRVRNSVIRRAATAYLELAKVRQSLELLRAAGTSARRIVEITRERESSGLELPLEITRQELAAAKIQQHIVQFENRDEFLSTQVRTLTGLPPGQPLEVSPEILPAPAEASADILVLLALDRNFSILEAQNERAARQHILGGERAAYFPSVGLVGQYSVLSKINHYEQFYNNFQRNNLNLGVVLRIPIFTARTPANVTLARNQAAEADLNLGNLRDEARLEAEQKLRELRERDATRDVARLDLKFADQNLALVQTKFDQGQAPLKLLEEARMEQSEKSVALLEADFAKQQAQLAFMEISGQLESAFP